MTEQSTFYSPPDKGFFASVPRLIRTGYENLSATAKWIYVCLKDLCGENGTCYRALRTLSIEVGVSTGMLSESIRLLCEAGLITAEKKRRPDKPTAKEVWHISIVNIWKRNGEHHPTPKRSHSEQNDSSPEQPSQNVHTVNKNVQNVNKTASNRSPNEPKRSHSETEEETSKQYQLQEISVEEEERDTNVSPTPSPSERFSSSHTPHQSVDSAVSSGMTTLNAECQPSKTAFSTNINDAPSNGVHIDSSGLHVNQVGDVTRSNSTNETVSQGEVTTSPSSVGVSSTPGENTVQTEPKPALQGTSQPGESDTLNLAKHTSMQQSSERDAQPFVLRSGDKGCASLGHVQNDTPSAAANATFNGASLCIPSLIATPTGATVLNEQNDSVGAQGYTNEKNHTPQGDPIPADHHQQAGDVMVNDTPPVPRVTAMDEVTVITQEQLIEWVKGVKGHDGQMLIGIPTGRMRRETAIEKLLPIVKSENDVRGLYDVARSIFTDGRPIYLGNLANDVVVDRWEQSQPSESPQPLTKSSRNDLECDIRSEHPTFWIQQADDPDFGLILLIWYGDAKIDYMLIRDREDWEYWREDRAMIERAEAYADWVLSREEVPA